MLAHSEHGVVLDQQDSMSTVMPLPQLPLLLVLWLHFLVLLLLLCWYTGSC